MYIHVYDQCHVLYAVYILLYMCVPSLVFCLYHFQIIVFIVGGGNYIEYQNLQDYSKVCTSCCDIHPSYCQFV